MLITKLKMIYFGRFMNREIELKPGINLISGQNEAGKTTIHTFIKGMLFGIERLRGRGAASKDDIYTKYLPWDYPGAYGGQMDISVKDRLYRLNRSFHANDKRFSITDIATGREIRLKEGLISELVPNLTESVFRNTISIEQLKARTDNELALEVRNYITNLSIAKSKEVNVAKAISLLSDKKRALDAELNPSELISLKEEIESDKEKEDELDAMTIDLNSLLAEKEELRDNLKTAAASLDNAMADRMEQLPAVLEKYRSYKELRAQAGDLGIRLKGLKDNIASCNSIIESTGSIKKDIEQAERISMLLPELSARHEGLEKDQIRTGKKVKVRNQAVSLGLGLIAVIIAFIFLRPAAAGLLSAAGLSAAILLLFILNRAARKKALSRIEVIKELEERIAKEKGYLDSIYQKHNIVSKKELLEKQEELLRSSFALEHGERESTQLNREYEDIGRRCELLHNELVDYIGSFLEAEELAAAHRTDGKQSEDVLAAYTLSDDVISRLQANVRQHRQEISDKLENNNRRLNECNLKIAELRGRISTLEGNEELLMRNIDKYDRLMKKREENELELEAVKLAINTIQALAADIHDSFGRKLNEAVSGIISNITGQKYSDLKVDERLDIKVGISGSYIMLDRLSAGTMDQIYFALRLTVADLLLGDDRMPILLDDSFSLYDEQRIRYVLKQLADREQVILFSCHDRERQVLEGLELPFYHVELS